MDILEVLWNLFQFIYEAMVSYAQTPEGQRHIQLLLDGLNAGGSEPTPTTGAATGTPTSVSKHGVPLAGA